MRTCPSNTMLTMQQIHCNNICIKLPEVVPAHYISIRILLTQQQQQLFGGLPSRTLSEELSARVHHLRRFRPGCHACPYGPTHWNCSKSKVLHALSDWREMQTSGSRVSNLNYVRARFLTFNIEAATQYRPLNQKAQRVVTYFVSSNWITRSAILTVTAEVSSHLNRILCEMLIPSGFSYMNLRVVT